MVPSGPFFGGSDDGLNGILAKIPTKKKKSETLV